MRHVLLAGILILSACSTQTPGSPQTTQNLRPYATSTPSATPSQVKGLVISFETPVPSPTPFPYKIATGDTLSQVAQKFNVSLDALLAANPNIDPNTLSVGKTILIPSSPRNTSGEGTPTPVAFQVQQIVCYPQADRSLGCLVLVHNDSSSTIENVTAQVSLEDEKGRTISSQTTALPLDILPPGSSLPLMAFFEPEVPTAASPQVQILTGVQILPGDQRYLPASIQNSLAQVDWSGRSAQVSGTVALPQGSKPARMVWVAAAAYASDGTVVGMNRWESKAGLPPGGSLPFSFLVSSLAGTIERVDFLVEARP